MMQCMHRSKSDLINMIIKYGQLKYLEGRRRDTNIQGVVPWATKTPEKYTNESLNKLEQIEDIIYNEL